MKDKMIVMMPTLLGCSSCKDCEYYDENFVSCRANQSPGKFCLIKGEEFNRLLNVGKYICCEARDLGGRLFILSLNDGIDAYTKRGWWNMFTLSTKDIDKTGYYLCKIEKFASDKNGHDMCIVEPVKLMGDASYVRDNMNGIYLLSKSMQFAAFDQFACVARDSQYNYRNAYSVFDDEHYDDEIYWLNEIVLAKRLLRKYLADEVTLDEISKAVTIENKLYFWRNDVFYSKCGFIASNMNRYAEQYPEVYRKILNNKDNSTFSDYVSSVLDKYIELCDSCLVKVIEPYDSVEDGVDLLDMMNEVALYYKKIYSEKRAAEKAARKEKRLLKKKLKEEETK